MFLLLETVQLKRSEENTERRSATLIKADRLTTTALCNAAFRDHHQQTGSGGAQGGKTVGPPTHKESGSALMRNAGDGS